MLYLYRYTVFLVFLTGSILGQNFFPILGGQRAGTSIFTFLKIGVSARAEGMGEAVVALQQDAASIYYNPGVIAQFSGTKFSASRIKWPADINYDYFALTQKLSGRHSIGFSAGILHMAPMMEPQSIYPTVQEIISLIRIGLLGLLLALESLIALVSGLQSNMFRQI